MPKPALPLRWIKEIEEEDSFDAPPAYGDRFGRLELDETTAALTISVYFKAPIILSFFMLHGTLEMITIF
jgi:hypothetical protein